MVVLGTSGGDKIYANSSGTMWVVAERSAVLSVVTGDKWVEITSYADSLYQHLVVTAERKFWRCVEGGEPYPVVEPPRPRIEAVRIADMTNAQAEFAAVYIRTREAHLEHERAKAELKSLVLEDAAPPGRNSALIMGSNVSSSRCHPNT